MKKKFVVDRIKTISLFGLMFAAIPASAHVSAMHSVNDFQAGFLHPLMGLDHLLAMLAVGIWAAQHPRPGTWLLTVVFPLMMVVGAIFGIAGVSASGIEAGIAASVLILGLLIATSVRLALPFGASLIAVFAMAHGYAHGVELPHAAEAITFGSGFVLSTALLHASGVGLSIVANRSLHTRFIRCVGAVIAMAGLFFVTAIA